MALLQKELIARLPHTLLVQHYLLASYLYYHLDQSPMTDEAYDLLCQRLDTNWSRIKHPHLKLIKRPRLEETTGYNIKQKSYPRVVQHAALVYLESVQDGSILQQLNSVLLPAKSKLTRTPVRRTPVVPAPVPKPAVGYRRRTVLPISS